MAERRATNKYYPPEWTPKQGSINAYMGQHPLRDRARKLDEGILIIRFELPYNIWCDGCGNHIGMGVRYNAQKKKVGMYYSTPIFNFRMKCHLCDNWFEIQTDPKARDYVIVSGARRKVETWDAAENETAVLPDDVEQAKMADNAFARTEHAIEDETKAKTAATSLEDLLERRKDDWSDPFTISQKMRKTFREKKKIIEAAEADATSVAERNALAIPVLPRAPEDELEAAHVFFRTSNANFREQFRQKRAHVLASSIFDDSAGVPCQTPSKRAKSLPSSADLPKASGVLAIRPSSTTKPVQPKSTHSLATFAYTTGINPKNFRLMDGNKDTSLDQSKLLSQGTTIKPQPVSSKPKPLSTGLVNSDYGDDD